MRRMIVAYMIMFDGSMMCCEQMLDITSRWSFIQVRNRAKVTVGLILICFFFCISIYLLALFWMSFWMLFIQKPKGREWGKMSHPLYLGNCTLLLSCDHICRIHPSFLTRVGGGRHPFTLKYNFCITAVML